MTAGLVFDFDGTILDTEDSIFRSWAEVFAKHDHEIDRASWQSTMGGGSGYDPQLDLERRLGQAIAADLVASRRARRAELLADRTVRPGVESWIDSAERLGIPIAVASSSPSRWVERHLRRLSLRSRIAFVACADEGVLPKPDPSVFESACEGIGADPRISVAVEDTPIGATAASRAGLYVVAVPHALTEDLDFVAADVVVSSLDELELAHVLVAAQRRHSAQ